MITALSISVPEHKKGIKGITDRLKKDRLNIEIKKARGVSLKHVTYTSYSGEVRLNKADRAVGSQRMQLLCSDKLIFPVKSGYRRFSSSDFSARLCTNMALEVLKKCKRSASLKVGIYDKTAVACDCLVNILEYCSNVIVITQSSTPYYYMAEKALNELGATALITKSVADISNSDLVIAPTDIEEPLELRSDAVVLTVNPPKIKTGAAEYYRYNFRMPNGFDVIKPEELDEEYFCSALYTLGSQYELGSIVPLSCRNETVSQTVPSLCAALEE